MCRVMVESPWWLAAKKRYGEAEQVLEKIAKWNKVPVTAIHLRRHDQVHDSTALSTETKVGEESENVSQQVQNNRKRNDVTVKLIDLVQDHVLLKVSLISVLLWSVFLQCSTSESYLTSILSSVILVI